MAATGLTGAELLDLLAELDAELDTPVSILIAGGAALAIRWGGAPHQRHRRCVRRPDP